MKKTIQKILLGYDPIMSNLLPVLREADAYFGHISKKNAEKISDYFDIPISKIYETASFYDLISVEKKPNLVIKVCSGTNCATNQSFGLIKVIENFFKIKAGDEFNPRVRLEVMSCLGRCGEGPIMVINEKVYERVTENSAMRILKEWTQV